MSVLKNLVMILSCIVIGIVSGFYVCKLESDRRIASLSDQLSHVRLERDVAIAEKEKNVRLVFSHNDMCLVVPPNEEVS